MTAAAHCALAVRWSAIHCLQSTRPWQQERGYGRRAKQPSGTGTKLGFRQQQDRRVWIGAAVDPAVLPGEGSPASSMCPDCHLYMRRSSAMEACTSGPCMGARHSTSRLSTSGLTPRFSSPNARSCPCNNDSTLRAQRPHRCSCDLLVLQHAAHTAAHAPPVCKSGSTAAGTCSMFVQGAGHQIVPVLGGLVLPAAPQSRQKQSPWPPVPLLL